MLNAASLISIPVILIRVMGLALMWRWQEKGWPVLLSVFILATLTACFSYFLANRAWWLLFDFCRFHQDHGGAVTDQYLSLHWHVLCKVTSLDETQEFIEDAGSIQQFLGHLLG